MKRFFITLVVVFVALQISFAQFNVEHLLQTGVRDVIDGKYHDAIKKFNTILEVKPNNWQAIYLRGIAKFYLGDTYGAQCDFTTGIGINSVFSEFYLLRGGTYQMQSDYTKALEDYNEAESLDPANPSVYVNKGLIYAIQSDYAEAIRLLTKSLTLKNDYAEPYLYRGFCYTEIKDFENAAKDINKAISINKFDDRAFIWRGKMQYDKGEYDFAINDFSRALAIAPDNSLTYFYRAITYYEKKNYNNAIADLDSVLSISPNNDLALYNRALLNYEIGLPDKALADLERVLRIKPNNVIARYNKATIHLELNQYPKAITELSQIVEQYPDFLYAYYARAEARMSMGDMRGAMGDRILADSIRKRNNGNEIGDTTKFKELIKFDADFVKEGDKELLAVGTIAKDETSSVYIPNYYVALSPDDKLPLYYSESIAKLNLKYKVENHNFIATNVDTLKFDYKIMIDSIAEINEMPLPAKYLMTGSAEAMLDNFNSARDIFSKLISVENLAVAYLNRAWVNCEVIDMLRSFDETPQEISIISRSMSFDAKLKSPQSTTLYNYSEVLDDLNKAIELDPKLYFAYFNRGNVLCRTQNYHEAILEYSSAIELNDEFAEAYINRGLTYMRLNDTANACISLSKAGELGYTDVYPILRRYCK